MSKTREQKKKMKAAKKAAAKKKGSTKKKAKGHGRKPVCPDCRTKDVDAKGTGNTIQWWFCKNCSKFFHTLLKGVA